MQQTKAYEKVIEHIKKQIINHDLTIGEKLPPEREISEQLGVSRNSVREAIHMLEMMGFISSQQGAGNYVSCNFEKNLVESMSMAPSHSCVSRWRCRPLCLPWTTSAKRRFRRLVSIY